MGIARNLIWRRRYSDIQSFAKFIALPSLRAGKSQSVDDKQDMTGTIRNSNPNKSYNHLDLEITDSDSRLGSDVDELQLSFSLAKEESLGDTSAFSTPITSTRIHHSQKA